MKLEVKSREIRSKKLEVRLEVRMKKLEIRSRKIGPSFQHISS